MCVVCYVYILNEFSEFSSLLDFILYINYNSLKGPSLKHRLEIFKLWYAKGFMVVREKSLDSWFKNVIPLIRIKRVLDKYLTSISDPV